MNRVSLVSSSGLSFEATIERSVELLEFKFKPNIQNVAIKPDLCYFWDQSTGQTTSPELVKGIIDFLRNHIPSGLEFSMVAADRPAAKCKDLFRFLGYEKLAKDRHVKLVNLSVDDYEEAEATVGNSRYTLRLPNTIKKADLFINVPRMKIKPRIKISCALANVCETSFFLDQPNRLASLDEMIVAANKLLKPSLTVTDGLWVRGKRTRKLGLVMSGVDPVTVDSVAARLVGLNPDSIDHIEIAEREGIGFTKSETVGEDFSHFAELFPRDRIEDKMWSAVAGFGLAALRRLGREV
jgi:uncharacterized protein (DUF362 family)